MKLSATNFFKTKSFLMACQVAGWNVDRVPDSDLRLESFMSGYRIGQAKRTIDPTTGRKRVEDTDLVNRLRARGVSDEELEEWPTIGPCEPIQGMRHIIREVAVLAGYTPTDLSDSPSMQTHQHLTSRNLLHYVRKDIYEDVCGTVPFSSLGYMQFDRMEAELKRIRNPLYIRVYETDPNWRKNKRFGLVYLALQQQDEDCLRAMAQVFEGAQLKLRESFYWNMDMSSLQEKIKKENVQSDDQCTVM